MPDLSGRRIGDYQLTARIGQGGMAVVYQGRHIVSGETALPSWRTWSGLMFHWETD